MTDVYFDGECPYINICSSDCHQGSYKTCPVYREERAIVGRERHFWGQPAEDQRAFKRWLVQQSGTRPRF